MTSINLHLTNIIKWCYLFPKIIKMYHSASNDKRKKKQVEVTTETSPYTTWKSNIKWWDGKAPAFVALHLAPNITD